ncbi:MAG: hypothetical protein ACMUIG_09205 [Thermoplasmatota archaeon]
MDKTTSDPASGNTAVSAVVIIIGFVILISGCSYAVITHRSAEREEDRREDADYYADNIVSAYGIGGRLSYQLFISDDGPGLDSDGRNGRPARISLITFDGIDHVKFVPDRESVTDHQDNPSSSARRYVSIDTGDGPIIPGVLEVILYE